MKSKVKDPKPPRSKYRPLMVLEVYKMARMGMAVTDMIAHYKIAKRTWELWTAKHPELQAAVVEAKRERAEGETLPDWVYTRLSPELRAVWNKVRRWEKEPNGVIKIELMLAEQGKLVRQQLFLHALCVSHFSPTLALRRVNVTKHELEHWIEHDPDFAKLVEEIDWHKGNFFESQLMRLVEDGNPAAVLFANKTYNRNRGYTSRSQVDVNVSGSVAHGVLDLTELLPYLREEVRLELLAAIRQREQVEADRLRPVPIRSVQEIVAEQIAQNGA